VSLRDRNDGNTLGVGDDNIMEWNDSFTEIEENTTLEDENTTYSETRNILR